MSVHLFIAYSLDTQVNSFFNSFRYSILPVGIIDSATCAEVPSSTIVFQMSESERSTRYWPGVLGTSLSHFTCSKIICVGIIDSNEYILLKNGAPELEGQWALSAYPGTMQEDGSVSRYYVA